MSAPNGKHKRKYVYISTKVANQLLKDLFSEVPNLPDIKVRLDGEGKPIDFRVYDGILKQLVNQVKKGNN